MESCDLTVKYHFSFGLFCFFAVSWMSCANQPLIMQIFWDSSSICAPPRTGRMALIVKNRLIVVRNLKISRIQPWSQHITILTNWYQHENWRRWRWTVILIRVSNRKSEAGKREEDKMDKRKRKWLTFENWGHWH